MAPSAPTRLDRRIAFAVLALLFGGVGALGWLLGHVATYDATGHAHAHASHGYMQPVQQGGTFVALAGAVLAVLAVSLGRRSLARWVAQWRTDGGLLPWFAAALLPATSFLLVEGIEGSVAARGLDLLLVGVPLQAAIGIAVLAIVRSLLTALVLVVDRLAARATTPRRRSARRASRPIVRIRTPRLAPMATNAALRAPPRSMP